MRIDNGARLNAKLWAQNNNINPMEELAKIKSETTLDSFKDVYEKSFDLISKEKGENPTTEKADYVWSKSSYVDTSKLLNATSKGTNILTRSQVEYLRGKYQVLDMESNPQLKYNFMQELTEMGVITKQDALNSQRGISDNTVKSIGLTVGNEQQEDIISRIPLGERIKEENWYLGKGSGSAYGMRPDGTYYELSVDDIKLSNEDLEIIASHKKVFAVCLQVASTEMTTELQYSSTDMANFLGNLTDNFLEGIFKKENLTDFLIDHI